MMAPMATKTTGEKKDDGENDNHAYAYKVAAAMMDLC
jgi:hypothetical protein